MAVLALFEVLGKVRDAVAEQRDLAPRRTGVALGLGVLGDDLLLGLRVGTDRHSGAPSVLVARRARACSPGHSGSAAVVTACRPRGQPQKHIEAQDRRPNPRRAARVRSWIRRPAGAAG